MAASVSFRPFSTISRSGFLPDSDKFTKEPSISCVFFAQNLVTGDVVRLRYRVCSISVRSRCFPRRSGFADNGGLEYYASPRWSGGKNETKKGSEEAVAMKKKKKKLIKGLSKKLLEFSGIDFGGEGLIGEVRGKIISEAASVLLAQLEQLKEEEKEKKRKQKEKKATLRTASWISYSSESSDSEYEEIITTNCLRSGDLTIPIMNDQSQKFLVEAEVPLTDSYLSSQEQRKTGEVINNCNSSRTCAQECNTNCNAHSSSLELELAAEKIEVCMGGKCKKSGSLELLEELDKMIGIEGAVVGCKCMGKCKKGPNLRIMNKEGEGSVGHRTSSVFTGVGLQNIEAIAGIFLGNAKENDMGLLAA